MTTPDCLIIGGGVIGLSLAYDLAQHGLRVRIVDRQEAGREASWAGAGILPATGPDEAHHPLDQLRVLSYQLHPHWAASLFEATGIDNGYRQCGGIYLARSHGEAAALGGLIGLMREERIAIDRLTPTMLIDLEPALRPLAESGYLRAAYRLPTESQLRNPDHLQALLKATRDLGVEFSLGTHIASFEIEQGQVRAALSEKNERLPAQSFCLTAGAWTRQLLEPLELPNGILPVKGQMVMFRCQRPPLQHILNEGPRYVVPRDDGRVLVGSTEEEVGFQKQTTPDTLQELAEFGRQLVDPLHAAVIEKSWAGLRPGSFDGLPYLGQAPNLDNVYVAAGHFRNGLFLSPATAVVMGRLIRGENTQIDLSPFYPGRG